MLGDTSSQSVLAALPGKTYWHFATHGRFDWDDARNSALLLSSGQLTVNDLIGAAEGGVLSAPRLVVLSACETGLYDVGHNPEEFTGLPLAFMSLGAAGVLSTLWPVVDDATMLLVAKFYDLHRDQGFAPPGALKRAQAWLRSASKDELIAFARAAADTEPGPLPDRVWSTVKGQNGVPYGGMDGTSQATPHVSGAIALALSAHPEWRHKPDVIESVLRQSAAALPPGACSAATPCGVGQLDAGALVTEKFRPSPWEQSPPSSADPPRPSALDKLLGPLPAIQ
jgi:CHAT domain-containing protein